MTGVHVKWKEALGDLGTREREGWIQLSIKSIHVVIDLHIRARTRCMSVMRTHT